ncbi:MAG TPA: hypothetical protein VGQ83_04820 [Polyangia bacterium]
MKKLVKVIGLSVAAAGLMTWLGASNAYATKDYAKATGRACSKCHTGAPKKDNLNADGKAFQTCLKSKKDAAKCK